MTNGWQTVSLGEFLTERKEFFTIDDFSRYKRARVQSHGKGIVLRDEIDGTEIKTKKQQAARTGEFLVAEIDAKVGGFGIVPPELDGAVVSSHYFLFQINEKKCLKDWLYWFVRYNSLEDQVKAQGSTNYAAIRPSHVLNFEIPLPPLDEQHRIVERVQTLSACIAKVQSMREDSIEEADALQNAILLKIFDELKNRVKPLPIGETNLIFNNLTRNPQKNQPNEEFLYVDIAAVENGTGKITSPQKIMGSNAPSRARRVIRENDIILSTVRPNLKAFAIVPPELDNQICSTGFAVFSSNPEILPNFLLYQFFSPYFVNQAIETVTGGHYPALNDKALNLIEIIIPPLDEQRRIVAYLDSVQARLASLKQLQAETQKELNALLPSVLDRAFKGEL